jgi:hypothetical protein
MAYSPGKVSSLGSHRGEVVACGGGGGSPTATRVTDVVVNNGQQQGMHLEHAMTREGRQALLERWLNEEGQMVARAATAAPTARGAAAR